jgi:hypothetical protein
MPELNGFDTQRGYRIAGKMREIALGTQEHPADDPDLVYATDLGHVEHNGDNWQLTHQGIAANKTIL